MNHLHTSVGSKLLAGLALSAASLALATPAHAATTPDTSGRPASGTAATVAAASSSTCATSVISANEKAAWDFFREEGLTTKQTAGVIGNLDEESHMDPHCVQGGGPGRGIAQWSVGGRWDTSSGDNEVHYTNVVLGVSRYNLTGQFKFVWHELSINSGYGLSALKRSTTIDGAVVVFQNDYERPYKPTEHTSVRESYAAAAYKKYT